MALLAGAYFLKTSDQVNVLCSGNRAQNLGQYTEEESPLGGTS